MMLTLTKYSLFKFKLLYFTLFCGFGILSPYIAIFFESLLLIPKSQIGILNMIPNLCSFLIAPIFGFIGDKLQVNGEILLISLITSTVTTTCMLYMSNFNHQLPIVILNSIFKASLVPQLDSMTISSLYDKAQYGTIRLWGAVSFGIFSLIGGLLIMNNNKSLQTNSLKQSFMIIFYINAFTCIFAGYIVLWIFIKEEEQSYNSKINSINNINIQKNTITSNNSNYDYDKVSSIEDMIENDSVSLHEYHNISMNKLDMSIDMNNNKIDLSRTTKETSSRMLNLSTSNDRDNILGSLSTIFVNNPSVLIFGIVVFLSGFGAGVIDSYLFLHIHELGGSGLIMGIARFITCVAEVPMFQIAGYLQQTYGTWMMIMITQGAFVIRFIYYVLLKNPWYVLPCEFLNGLTFAVTWSVSCTYANEISSEHCKSIMQSILEGIHFGIGCGTGSIVGGYAYECYGAKALFAFCGILSFISMLLSMSVLLYNHTHIP